MSEASKVLLEQALELPSAERVLIAEQLLLSLDQPDTEIDSVWSAEVEARLEAYREGRHKALPLSELLRQTT